MIYSNPVESVRERAILSRKWIAECVFEGVGNEFLAIWPASIGFLLTIHGANSIQATIQRNVTQIARRSFKYLVLTGHNHLPTQNLLAQHLLSPYWLSVLTLSALTGSVFTRSLLATTPFLCTATRNGTAPGYPPRPVRQRNPKPAQCEMQWNSFNPLASKLEAPMSHRANRIESTNLANRNASSPVHLW